MLNARDGRGGGRSLSNTASTVASCSMSMPARAAGCDWSPDIGTSYRERRCTVCSLHGPPERSRSSYLLGPLCQIVTTEPNEQMSALHDRMPVVLHPDDYGGWLGEEPAPRPS